MQHEPIVQKRRKSIRDEAICPNIYTHFDNQRKPIDQTPANLPDVSQLGTRLRSCFPAWCREILGLSMALGEGLVAFVRKVTHANLSENEDLELVVSIEDIENQDTILYPPRTTRPKARSRIFAPIAWALIAILYGGGVVAAANSPVFEGNHNMSEQGESYRTGFPIKVPRFCGLEPDLALTYGATGKEELAGVDWLIGFSTIKREGDDGGVPRWDATDRYWLDGQELFECSQNEGSSCTSGATHWTNDDRFQCIRQNDQNTWIITDQDGTQYTYSLLMGWSNGRNYLWGLNQVTDVQGYSVIYDWWCDSEAGYPGACYPDSITEAKYFESDLVSMGIDIRPNPDEGRGTLSSNRDRLFRDWAQRKGYGDDICGAWRSLTRSQKGVFLTITHRLWEATVYSTGKRALTHVTALYSIMGARRPFDCGGGDYNRLFMSMDHRLKDAFIRAAREQRRALDVLGTFDHWRPSHDIAGPHKPFNGDAETHYGGPRGQAHFFITLSGVRPICRAGLNCLWDPMLLEMDQDYNVWHDSNPECWYGGQTGRQMYQNGHPGVDYAWAPIACDSSRSTCPDGRCNPETEDCGNCPEDCPCPEGTDCYSNELGDFICVPLQGCETDDDCPADLRCESGFCVGNCGDGDCEPGVEDCGNCPGDCPCPSGYACIDNRCQSLQGCGDSDCEPGVEDCGNCPRDCPCPHGTKCVDNQCQTYCGNGTCEPGIEDCGNCPEDCPCPSGTHCENNRCVDDGPMCGDGDCEPGVEDCGVCPQDCPCPKGTRCENRRCVTYCGNGKCDGYPEDCGTCPGDCPCPQGYVCRNRRCVVQ